MITDHFKPHEHQKVAKLFSRYIPDINPADIHDGEETARTGRLIIDLNKLEGRLANLYPKEIGSFSMEEIIRKHYGYKAVFLIRKLI